MSRAGDCSRSLLRGYPQFLSADVRLHARLLFDCTAADHNALVDHGLLVHGLEIIALLREGKSWTGEFPVLRRDGTEIPVLVTDSPIRDALGRLVGIIGVSLDLTARKHAERERLERARLEALLIATEAAQQELSERLTLNVPYVGQLANDPTFPAHLRPLAGTVLEAMGEVATRLEHSLELPEDV